jgi:hypothetical protein
MTAYLQWAGVGVHIVVAASLLGLAIWGYVTTRLNGMLLLGLWVVWTWILSFGLNLLIWLWWNRAGPSATAPSVSYAQLMTLVGQARQLIGAIVLGAALAVLILEVRRLREAQEMPRVPDGGSC